MEMVYSLKKRCGIAEEMGIKRESERIEKVRNRIKRMEVEGNERRERRGKER